MESSRIFVKGLPPTFTETEFRKHFSQGNRDVTDVKIFPSRRIGYVGYKTCEDAQRAVKYFNKTFIRMSRIGVELARPVEESKGARGDGGAPTARRDVGGDEAATGANLLKRKRDVPAEEQDPKLKEFLDVYKPKSKKNAWEPEGIAVTADATMQDAVDPVVDAEAQSDDEYEQVPKKKKRPELEAESNASVEQKAEAQIVDEHPSETVIDTSAQQDGSGPVSDADWARSRTSRLLGLLDDEEEDDAGTGAIKPASDVTDDEVEDLQPVKPAEAVHHADGPATSIPTPPADASSPTESVDPEIAAVRSSMRLFIRNLPYNVQKEDLQDEFSSFGSLEDVRQPLSVHLHYVMSPDRDNLCYGI